MLVKASQLLVIRSLGKVNTLAAHAQRGLVVSGQSSVGSYIVSFNLQPTLRMATKVQNPRRIHMQALDAGMHCEQQVEHYTRYVYIAHARTSASLPE